MTGRAAVWAAFAAASAAAPALAQSSGAPPIARADNAYGLRVGNEEIGLYDSDAIRGFALDTGANYRLDGAYVAALADRAERVGGSVSIQAGPNLFDARFPSPTGVVDLVTDHAATPGRNLILRGDGFGSLELLARVARPLAGGAVWATGEVKRQRQYHGGRDALTYGALGGDIAPEDWRLRGGVSLGHYRLATTFALYPAVAPGDLPTYRNFLATPPRWTAMQGDEIVAWGSAERALGDGWRLRGSLRYGRYTTDRDSFVFLDRVDETGRGELNASAFGQTRARATSGELLVERQWPTGHGPARLSAALIARDQRAALAPSADLAPGPVRINDRIDFADPGAPAGVAARDLIREGRIAASAAYPPARWLLLSGSIERVAYTKAYAPDGQAGPRRTDRAWSGHLAATVALSPRLSLYGAWVTGLEESGTAPAIAINANETLPALRATQREAGAKLNLAPGATLLLAAFAIEKAAPGFDAAGVWRLSGTRRHRGLESSLVTGLGDIQLVTGALFLDAKIRETGGTIAQVVGEPRWRGSVNAQWQADARLAVDAGAYLLGRSPARRDGTTQLAGRTDVSLGSTVTLGSRTAPTLRIAASNLLDTRGWTVQGDESLYPIESRTIRASLALAW